VPWKAASQVTELQQWVVSAIAPDWEADADGDHDRPCAEGWKVVLRRLSDGRAVITAGEAFNGYFNGFAVAGTRWPTVCVGRRSAMSQ
jgi:hypothetical protein